MMHPVAYFSMLLQRNWSTHMKEAFSLLLAVRHSYVYLAGTRFILKSDHNPLKHMRNQKDHGVNLPDGSQNWKNLTMKYIPGKCNIKADSRSRNQNADDKQPLSQLDEKIFTINEKGVYESILTTVLDNARVTEQIKQEQLNDAKEIVLGNGRVKRGRLKRVQNQL